MSADITLCTGGGCPHRSGCYRFRLIAHGRQDSFSRPPYDPKAGTCSALWALSTLAPTEAQISDRAYHIWQEAGCPEGQQDAHWRQARQALEDSLRARLRPLEESP